MKLTDLPSYSKLESHFAQIKDKNLRELFSEDPERAKKFSLEIENIFLDFSKNRITQETLALLLALAQDSKVKESIEAMFSGEKINTTENRAVLHVALRNMLDSQIVVDGANVMEEINNVLIHMREFAEQVRSGQFT